MKTVHRYIERSVQPVSRLSENLTTSTEVIIVVPVHDEAQYLNRLLFSLDQLENPGFNTEVIFVINHSIDATSAVKESNLLCQQLILEHVFPMFIKPLTIFLEDLPSKKAGVGLARKIGMDAAVWRFNEYKKNGIILCLDADCEVDKNYLLAIYQGMDKHIDKLGCSIYFEHPLNDANSTQIIDYELHLRYFIDIQKSIGLPYAIQTVGSSMAVRTEGYAAYGGMNKRQAGEDFYFLQKFISVGSVFELNDTCVRPSDRSSSRVPFGTGKAIKDMLSQNEGFYTYDLQSFLIIADFLSVLRSFYTHGTNNDSTKEKIHTVLMAFLNSQDWHDRVEEIKDNTKTFSSFQKRFYKWFNAFLLMKCLHYMRDNGFPNVEVGSMVGQYLWRFYDQQIPDKKDQLLFLRQVARGAFS